MCEHLGQIYMTAVYINPYSLRILTLLITCKHVNKCIAAAVCWNSDGNSFKRKEILLTLIHFIAYLKKVSSCRLTYFCRNVP